MHSKFTKWAVVILLGISSVSGFYIWRLETTRGLDLNLDIPEDVMSGVPFDVKVNFSNNSGATLNDARFAITLPSGAAFFGSPVTKTIENRSLGNIGNGSLVQESFKIVVIAPEQTNKSFKVTINYAPAKLGARFEKSASGETLVKSSGIEIGMSGPEKVTSGEEFELAVSYENISVIDFSDLEMRIEYPPTFTYNSASLKPDAENNVWRLGDLRKNSEGKITVKGSLTGGENDNYEFRTQISQRAAGENYPVSAGSFRASIAASPLSLSINLNEGQDHIAKAGDVLNYTLSYINETDISLNDVVIKAKLAGEMYDLSTIESPGVSRQGDNTLIWNPENSFPLVSLYPGSAGVVTFKVKLKDSFPIRRFSDKNYSLVVNAEINSSTQSQITGAYFLSKSRLETKVAGKVEVDAKSFFRDADSGFLNQGVFPPKAGQPTQFTVHWLLKSFAADVSNIEVRGILGNNVRMIGEARSNSGSLPKYNQETNEVFWQVDKLQANQGVVGSPIEAVFQVEAIPLATQVGMFMPIINATTIRATDSLSGQELTNSDDGISTALQDDGTVTPQSGVVQP